ncbi:MAG: apolipoprotein N-acyltransferase [Thermoguttaceae bacterium]
MGAALLWAAFPPPDFWFLAWIAPIPWVLLIRREKLDGSRPYFILWLAGFAFWLAVLHWLRLPYWATAFGWVALSFYFAFYLPLFIALSRTAVNQLRLPVIIVAPLVWTGLELARAHLLTGMTMASLGHTQYRWVCLIQISDLAGAYGVSFLVMFTAACLAQMPGTVPIFTSVKMGLSPWIVSFRPLIPAAAILAAVLAYGYARTVNNETTPGARIALIQGSLDFTVDADENFRKTVYSHYFDLSRQAIDKFGKMDLIIWPEIFFLYPLVIYDEDAGAKDPKLQAENINIEDYRKWLQSCAEASRRSFEDTAAALRSPLLVGLDANHFTAGGEKVYNSAAYVSASGELLGRYDKMHLVMFGEYIPLAGYFTWLYNLSPLSMGMTPGTQPAEFRVHAGATTNLRLVPGSSSTGATAGSSSSAVDRDILIAPNICYESVLPHVIRRQINTLQAQGKEPDVLINLTNDGWFWGSSELDLHLACGVFRAVECRKPFLIAANTGFSAWIDADGRIIEKGPRRATATLLACVRIDHRKSWYLYYGDWPSGICLAGCCVFAAAGLWNRLREKRLKAIDLHAGTGSKNE